MKRMNFFLLISTFLLMACNAEQVPVEDDANANAEVEDVLSNNTYDFNVQGYGMENTVSQFTFSGGSVSDGEDFEGTYYLEAETINIELTHEAAKVQLVLVTEDFGDGSLIEGRIETYEVLGQNFDEERIEEVDEFEGFDFVLERIEEDVELE